MRRFFDLECLIHSLKTAIASIIGLFAAKFIGKPADQWVIITIIVVMCSQIYVGSVLQRAYYRFFGTLLGCLFATLTIHFVGDTEWAAIITIGFACFIFSYISTIYESFAQAGTLGAVTTTIIMLSVNPTLLVAGSRVFEITLGIVIATLVSQFILPIHAREHLKRAQANTLKLLKNYYRVQLKLEPQKGDQADSQELDEEIVKSLLKQRTLGKESKAERLGFTFNQAHFLDTLYYERQMLRAVTFMHDTLDQIACLKEPGNLANLHLEQFHQQIMNALVVLEKVVSDSNDKALHIELPNIDSFRDSLHTAQGMMTGDDLIYFDGFISMANILVVNLQKLATLYGVATPSDEAPRLT